MLSLCHVHRIETFPSFESLKPVVSAVKPDQPQQFLSTRFEAESRCNYRGSYMSFLRDLHPCTHFTRQ